MAGSIVPVRCTPGSSCVPGWQYSATATPRTAIFGPVSRLLKPIYHEQFGAICRRLEHGAPPAECTIFDDQNFSYCIFTLFFFASAQAARRFGRDSHGHRRGFLVTSQTHPSGLYELGYEQP
jgi:hypothetical protein